MTISIDAGAVGAVVSTIGQTFAGLVPLIALAIAIPMLFYVARRIARFFPSTH